MSDAPEGAVVALPVAGDQSASSASFWLCVATLWRRELRGFYRQRSRVVGTLSTPLLFWLVLGSGFGSSLLATEGGYAQFFFPGMLALSVLFTSIFANISLIEDRREGFLLGVLVAPVSRLALVLGKVCGATTLGAVQGALLLPLAPLAGLSLDLANLPLIIAALLLMAFGVTCLGFFCAWWLNSVQGFHSIMNLVLMPMWLVSGGVFPLDGSSAWLRWLTAVNPLAYGVAELRRLLDAPGASTVPTPELSWLVLAGFGAVMLLGAWRKAVRPEAAHLS
ncbi:MAG: ABC transporter permease [Bryobacterales bacterium]|nr:ABC transporter permease [Bryobacterales bacterium]